MKTIKRLMVTGVIALVLVVGTIAAFAASHSTPAEVIAGLTGREVASVSEERLQTDQSYGMIAQRAGVLPAFKAERLGMKKEALAARVAAGTMTQEQAEAITAKIVSKQATCNGDGAGCALRGAVCGKGAGFGQGSGQGQKRCDWGHGPGGQCKGVCLRDGSCLNHE